MGCTHRLRDLYWPARPDVTATTRPMDSPYKQRQPRREVTDMQQRVEIGIPCDVDAGLLGDARQGTLHVDDTLFH